MKLSDLPPSALEPVAHIVKDSMDLELPDPKGWFVLTLLYIRGDKSAGGILYADKTKQEDVYQGRCGLVLATGPDAYLDETKYPNGAWCEAGDWVMWPAAQAATSRFKYGSLVLALLADDQVLATGLDPALTVMG